MVYGIHTDTRCASIETILNQFFGNRAQVDDHLARLYLMNLTEQVSSLATVCMSERGICLTELASMALMVAIAPGCWLQNLCGHAQRGRQ